MQKHRIMTVTILIFVILIAGVSAATITVDRNSITIPSGGETNDFVITVCDQNQPYVIYENAFFASHLEVDTSASWGTSPKEGFPYILPSNATCDTFKYGVTSNSKPGRFMFDIYEWDGKYGVKHDELAQIIITVVDLETVHAAENVAKIVALEEKVTKQEEKIAALQAPTLSPIPEPTTILLVETVDPIINETITPAITTPVPTPTIDYKARIAVLEIQIADQEAKQQQQQSILDRILAWFGWS